MLYLSNNSSATELNSSHKTIPFQLICLLQRLYLFSLNGLRLSVYIELSKSRGRISTFSSSWNQIFNQESIYRVSTSDYTCMQTARAESRGACAEREFKASDSSGIKYAFSVAIPRRERTSSARSFSRDREKEKERERMKKRKKRRQANESSNRAGFVGLRSRL